MNKTKMYKEIEAKLGKVSEEIINNQYRTANCSLNKVDEMLQEIKENRLTKKYFDRFIELSDLIEGKY